MKKILLSLGMIAVVAIVAVSATGAFFSDTETSTGNTFTAGAIDLKVDSQCTYNGVASTQCGTWTEKDLVPTSDKFFDFADIKPGDVGENTISLHVINNDAYVCATVSNLVDNENGINEPESAVDQTADVGELSKTMEWKVWRDDGDNVLETDEPVLASGHPTNGVLAVYDSTTGTPLSADDTAYLGVSWTLPSASGNETQTDSMTGDISFEVVQSRNNADFRCVPQQGPEMATMHLENKDNNWNVMNDNTSGVITYSVNDSTFNGTVTGTGLVANGYYQITLNGPTEASGTCGFTNTSLGGFGSNTFQSGFWNSAWPNLSSTCGANDEEGVYNMNLVNDHYTVQADGSGNINYSFNLDLPNGSYSGVKVLVKKMLDTHVSPWVDSSAEHTTNLFETASINFTVN